MFKLGMKTLLRGLAVLVVSLGWVAGKEITLLNVSYDPTRELYQDYNSAFARHWQEKTGDKVTIR
jgi:sulfate transport system substrate-binding protein